MCVSSFVDPSNRVVIPVCSGVVTLDEVKSSCAEVKAHPLFRSDFRQLIDLSEMSKLDLRYNELNLLAEFHDPFLEKGRRAVIAPHPVSFGVGRRYQMILTSPEFQGFRSHSEATTWLGLEGVRLRVTAGRSGT